jgi:hypothetical protein
MGKVFILSTLLIALLFSVIFLAPPANAGNPGPEIIPLPDGFRPEGIVLARSPYGYAGSLADGAIYRFNLLTGEGSLLVAGAEGRVAVGLAYDKHTNYLFVSGGTTGNAYVYDATTGAEASVYQLTTEDTTFINDAIVTREAVYFTDSSRPVYYRLPLSPGGGLPEPTAVEEIPLGGDFVFVPGAFNSNGIEATPGGRWLLIVHSSRGELYRVEPETGVATLIDLGGGAVPSGDGLLRDGHTLYVVQNFLNQIAVIDLGAEFSEGAITEVISDPNFRIPTTIAGLGPYLYVVNARFDTPPAPDTEYEVVRIDR